MPFRAVPVTLVLVSAAICHPLPVTYALPVAAVSASNDGPVRQVSESRNQIVKFTDTGIEPATLTTNKADSIVFFLNATSDSLITVKIEYGEKRMHCASSSLVFSDDGTVRSVRPFGPRNFTSACFPDRGSYTVTVYGLNDSADGASSTIVVE